MILKTKNNKFMKTYKIIWICSLFMGILLIGISCKKNEDNLENPKPTEKKKYAWACGKPDSTNFGLILFSEDGGDTWVRQGTGNLSLLEIEIIDIWAIDENTVWAIGSDNTVLKTSNTGNSWQKVNMPNNPSKPLLQALSIVNKTNIWISGEHGTVYKSTNCGDNWIMFDTIVFQSNQLQGIFAISPEKVYVAGGTNDSPVRGFIAYTLDGGNTWDNIVPANNYNKHEWIGVCSSGNTIVVYGRESHYVVSTNGGTTWKNDSVHNTGGGGGAADLNHLIMFNSQTWWGAFDMGQIFITHDGGASWISQLSGQGGFYLIGIDAWDSQLALSIGTPISHPFESPILKTSNGGTSWEKKYNYNGFLCKVTFIKD